MKKCVCMFLVVVLLLAGCASSRTEEMEETTEETTTETREETTENTSEETNAPDVGELDAQTLAEFASLFTYTMENPWYNMALTSEYAVPENLDLYNYFYNGFTEETISETERAKLKTLGLWMELDIQKSPVSRMDGVLRQVFGLGLKEMNGVGLEYMVYMEETDSYYKAASDFCNAESIVFLRGYITEDGSICLHYLDYLEREWVVTLVPADHDGYFVVSNLPA